MTSFFAEFLHSYKKGWSCTDMGLAHLSTAEECSGAVNYAKSFNGNAHYVRSGSFSTKLKGCFIDDSGAMFFNTHSTGRHSEDNNICRKGNT